MAPLESPIAEPLPSLPAQALSEPTAGHPEEPVGPVDFAQSVLNDHVELPTGSSLSAAVDPTDTSVGEPAPASSTEIVPPPGSGSSSSAELENSTSAAPPVPPTSDVESSPALALPLGQSARPSDPPVSAPPIMASRDVIDLTADSDEETPPSRRKLIILAFL